MDVRSRKARESLVVWPNSGREQLKKMAVGIPKIDACASLRPGEAALDGNAPLLEPLPPRRQTRRGNAETQVRLAARAVRRNSSKRQDRSFGIAATNKEQQDLTIANIESTEAVVGFHQRISK